MDKRLMSSALCQNEGGVSGASYITGWDFGLCAPGKEMAYVGVYKLQGDTLLHCLGDAHCYALLELDKGEREVSRTGPLKFRVFRGGYYKDCTLEGLLHLAGRSAARHSSALRLPPSMH